jgi:secreted trypsin-like serine protease
MLDLIDERVHVIGIVSADFHLIAIYTQVSKYIEWIAEKVNLLDRNKSHHK